MTDSSADRNPVEVLAEEFLRRDRRGERPTLSEYVARHPELADEIRALFPLLLDMEDVRPDPDDATGSFTPRDDHGVVEPMPGRIGDYRILRVIGSGGMGTVYEAEQESLGRHVAVKVLPRSMRDPKHLRRFEREARAAGRLHHTNIVPVFGVGHEGEVHYYVMQYIHGQPLDEVMAELRRLRDGRSPDPAPAAPAPRDRTPTAGDVARSLWSGAFDAAPARSGTERAPDTSQVPTEPALVADGSPSPDPESTPHAVALDGEGRPADEPVPPAGDRSPAERPSPAEPDAPESPSASSAPTGSSLLARSGGGTSLGDGRYARSVARIGVQAAEALGYAAGQGVIHRDIKPGNLLLDALGSVWITDFGLARASGEADLTGTGDLLGTLRYMAPERFRGQSDHRGDVYALGLTLYELLALRPAFDEQDRALLIRQITHGEPPRLERLDPTIPRDLATIVHKAMAKDPADRYASADELASDLQRYLEDRPIRARPLSAVGVGWRWCKRNPAVASLVATLTVVLLGVAVGSSVTAYRFRELAESEQEALRLANRRADEADDVVNFLIKDMIGSATPERKLGKAVTVDEVLERAERQLEGQFTGQPLREAAIRHAIALAFSELGDWDKGYQHLLQVCELYREQLGPEHEETLRAMTELAMVSGAQGRESEAAVLLKDLIETQRRVLGPSHPVTLSGMWALGTCLMDSDRSDRIAARSIFREVLVEQSRVLGRDHSLTLTTAHNLATILADDGDLSELKEARELCEQTTEAYRRVMGPDHPGVFLSRANLATIHYKLNEWQQARELHEQNLAACRRVMGPDHPDTLTSMEGLATVLEDLGDRERAFGYRRQVVEVRRRDLGPDHPRTLSAEHNYAVILRDMGEWEQARERFERVLEKQRDVLGEDHNDTLSTENDLAGMIGILGDLDSARQRFGRVFQVRRRVLGEDHPDTLRAWMNLARMATGLGDYE